MTEGKLVVSKWTWLACSVCCLPAACSNGVQVESASASTGSTTTAASSSGGGLGGSVGVAGTMVNRYYTETAALDLPVDLSQITIEAYVWEGNSWTTFRGYGKSDGTFTVPSVPEGSYMLHMNGGALPNSGSSQSPFYIYTTEHSLDLGSDLGGRPEAFTTQANTQATFSVMLDAVSSWQAADGMIITSPNAGSGGLESAPPATGATTLSGKFAWSGVPVDGSKGDTLLAAQYEPGQAAGFSYSHATRYMSLADVEQQSSTTAVNGTLQPILMGQAIGIDFRGSEFAVVGASINPAATLSTASLDLEAALGSATGVSATAGGLNLLSLVFTGGDQDLGNVPYGNPLPATCGTQVQLGERFDVPYTVPDGSAQGTLSALVWVVMSAAEASAAPLRPLLTPVRNLLVNGMGATQPLAGISATPSLSWSAPSTAGSTVSYVISIIEVQPTQMQLAPSIHTSATTLRLPPGLLQDGHAYVLQVTATTAASDPATKPFRASATWASADMLTNGMTP